MKTLLITLLLVVGCTIINQHKMPEPDFPALKVVLHEVDGGVVFNACYKYVPLWAKLLGAVPEGCAEVNFEDNTCTVWVRSDYPDKRVREHELLHCKGYDHPGDDAISGAWIQHRNKLLEIGK